MEEEYRILLEKVEGYDGSFILLKPWRMLWLQIRAWWFVSHFREHYAPLRAH